MSKSVCSFRCCLSRKQLSSGLFLVVCGWTYWVYAHILATPAVTPYDEPCGDVFASMTQGRWERLPMTSSQASTMKAFHKHVREEIHHMPPGLQREDGLCGNVSLNTWHRAVCDVDGETPCCYQHHCVNRSVADCTCRDCLDMREPLHGEYARWLPYDRQCQARDMTSEEVCRVLEGSSLLFVGDSFVRHVYTALLLLATGDDRTGAFRKDTPQDLRTRCAGIYIFTEKVCRMWVDHDVHVCPGKLTHLKFESHPFNADAEGKVSHLFGKPSSLVVFGLGIHGKFNASQTFRVLMQPVLSTMKDRKLVWPRVVWASVHHWGTLKNPNSQTLGDVLRFNADMERQLRPFPVDVMSTFNMTSTGVESFDGAHYGWGVNKVKALILLHHIKQLQSQKLW